jgi:hypothetical protein
MFRSLAAFVVFSGCAWLEGCAKPAPSVTIDAIPNGGVVRAVGSITGTAQDRSGIRSVSLYVDGRRAAEALVPRSGETKWRANIDTAKWPPGLHYLTAMARANSGAFSQGTITLVFAK